MPRRNWFQRFIHSINGEYERRVRAASEITDYHPSGSQQDDRHAPSLEPVEEEGAVEITNIPRGTRVRKRVAPPTDPALPPDETAQAEFSANSWAYQMHQW